MTEPAPWTKIFNRIKSQVPNAPDAVVRQEIFNVMLDFTSDTNLWIESVNLPIEPDVLSYPVTLADGFPNRLMIVYRPDDPQRRWADQGITMRVPGTIVLYRNQSQTQTWVAEISKVVSSPQLLSGTPPKDTGYPSIDSWIVDQNSDAIFYGTMWFLQRQPAKPYRDPIGARENSAIYSSQKAQARAAGLHQNVYGGQNWLFPQGFATISRKGWQ